MTSKYKPLLIVFLIIILGGIFISAQNTASSRIVKLGVLGTVHEIQWTTRNHNLPLFKIKTADSIVDFQHHRIIIEPHQTNVGDSFIKYSGSKICIINDKKFDCIR